MAGDQAGDMYDYLEPRGYMAVGGECPSVGVAGGYTPGGGHSPLTSVVGLAADQTLEFEVILANGRKVTASPKENPDLFWALSGGGPGTFGIVWSMTAKAFRDVPVSGSILTFTSGPNNTEAAFFSALEAWHAVIPNITKAGGYGYANYGKGRFTLHPIFAPNLTPDQLNAILNPFVAAVRDLGFAYNFTTLSYPSFNPAYKGLFPFLSVGQLQWGSRLIPKSVLLDKPEELAATVRALVDDNAIVVEAVMSPTRAVAGNPNNAVLPAWRDTQILLIAGSFWREAAPWEQMVADQQKITNVWTASLKRLAPDSGAYMNEADHNDPEWQKSFYGANYDRLRKIKKRYDPQDFFYATTAVGSEAWALDASSRLCRVRGREGAPASTD
jgi:FAD/FMN-containing dehydrogenase